MSDAASKFVKRRTYSNKGDFFVKETRYIYWDSGQCDNNNDATRNQADFGGSRTTMSANLVRCEADEELRVTVEELTLPYIWKQPPTPVDPKADQYHLHVQFLMPLTSDEWNVTQSAKTVYFPEMMKWYRDAQFNATSYVVKGDLPNPTPGSPIIADTWYDDLANGYTFTSSYYSIVDIDIDLYGHTSTYDEMVKHINDTIQKTAPIDVNSTTTDCKSGYPSPYLSSFPNTVVGGIASKTQAFQSYKIPYCAIDQTTGAFTFSSWSYQHTHPPNDGVNHPNTVIQYSTELNMKVPFRFVCYSKERLAELALAGVTRTGSGEAAYTLLNLPALDTYYEAKEVAYDDKSGVPTGLYPTKGNATGLGGLPYVAPTFRAQANDNTDYKYHMTAQSSGTCKYETVGWATDRPYKIWVLQLDRTMQGVHAEPLPKLALRDDYVLLEMEGCARNVAAYPTDMLDTIDADSLGLKQKYAYEQEPVIAKVDLPATLADKTVVWRNSDKAFGARYASNMLNQLAFRLVDPDWFKNTDGSFLPAVPFISSGYTWSLVLRVETLARKHTGLALMAESLFLQHIQVMQGDILMKKMAKGGGMPMVPPGDDKKKSGGEAARTPQEMFREVMAEFAAKHPSSLYPGGPGWSVNRLQQAMRPQTEQPALHADNTKNAPS